MLQDERPEAARIAERAAHHPRIGHRPQSVGEAERPRLLEQPHLGQVLAAAAARDRAVGEDLDQLHLARPPRDELDHGDIVDHRIGVRQAHQRGDAARRGGTAAALDGLLVLFARLAQLHAHVDEARRQAAPAAVDRLHALGRTADEQARADIDDPLAFDEQSPRRVQPGAGIQQPRVQIGDAAPFVAVVTAHHGPSGV